MISDMAAGVARYKIYVCTMLAKAYGVAFVHSDIIARYAVFIRLGANDG